MLTVGTLGHPNVGKSSLINSLLGKIQVKTRDNLIVHIHYLKLVLTLIACCLYKLFETPSTPTRLVSREPRVTPSTFRPSSSPGMTRNHNSTFNCVVSSGMYDFVTVLVWYSQVWHQDLFRSSWVPSPYRRYMKINHHDNCPISLCCQSCGDH